MTFVSSSEIDASAEKNFRLNAFLIGILGAMIVLFGIFLSRSVWYWGIPVPKSEELKIYALIVIATTIWFLIAPRIRSILSRSAPTSWMLFAIYLPLLIVLNALPLNVPIVGGLFCAGIVLLCGWCAECAYFPGDQQKKKAELILHSGLIVAIFLTVLLSQGTVFDLLTLWTIPVMGCVWWIVTKGRLPMTDRTLAILTGLLLLPLFLTVRVGYMDPEHYSFYLGPIIESLHGHWPLAAISPQYGNGMTVVMALYYRVLGSFSNAALIWLLRVLAYGQFLLFFGIAWSMLRSRALAIGALVTALFFAYFSQGEHYFAYPSTGFIRFGFPLIIAALYSLPENTVMRRIRIVLIAFTAAVASFWSFESMVYTIPAVIAAEWCERRLWKFLPTLAITLLCVWGGYFLFLVLNGQAPHLSLFWEYSLLYAKGFGQIPLERMTSLWWLFIPLALWGIADALWNRHPDGRIALLSIYALALFTYFGGRAHPNNLHHVSLPFILLLFVLLARLPSLQLRNVCLTGILVCALTVRMSFFQQWPVSVAVTHLLSASWIESLGTPVYDDCRAFEGYRPYIRNGTLAMLDDSLTVYSAYSCNDASNAFAVNPLKEIEISPNAVKRAAALARRMPLQPVLVETKDTPQHELTQTIMSNLILEKETQATIAGRTYRVYEGRGKDMLPSVE